MLWLSIARQTRPSDSPLSLYVDLAKKHHDVGVEVVDLGQYSAKHNNSCMFLTCAVALADRRERGYDDGPVGLVGEQIEAAVPFGQAGTVNPPAPIPAEVNALTIQSPDNMCNALCSN
eukprot:symbB.v1.2.022180.t1/scaffold1915.1/size133927/8